MTSPTIPGARFDEVKQDLGYSLLLKRYTPNVTDATDEQIKAAVDDSIPQVLLLFFAFRIMVACGILMLVLIGLPSATAPATRSVSASGCSRRCCTAFRCPDRHRGWLVCR